MKNIMRYCLLGFFMVSCSSTNDIASSSIVGTWEWVQSSGGISGATVTPVSGAKSMQLEISKSQVKRFENKILIATEPYTVETKKSILGGQKQMLIYASGAPSQTFTLDGNKLYLSDECYDCYQSEYIKK